MADDQVRELLRDLIKKRGCGMNALSRELGRNSAYIQQFLGRSSPRRLPEEVREQLAVIFGIDPNLLRPERADMNQKLTTRIPSSPDQTIEEPGMINDPRVRKAISLLSQVSLQFTSIVLQALQEFERRENASRPTKRA